MADDISRHKYALRAKQRELRSQLLAWDPIGIGKSGPGNEYDCLLRILGMLRGGMSAEQLSDFLTAELREHFGIDPKFAQPSAFAQRVYDWYWQAPLPGSR